MVRHRSILATLLVLSLAPGAHAGIANTFVWFDAVGLNPQSGIALQGVEGGNLLLSCDTSAGPTLCQWQVTMRMRNTVQVASLGTDLLGDTDKFTLSNPIDGIYPNSQFANHGHSYQTPNAGGVLAILKEVMVPVDENSQYDPLAGAPGTYDLVSFTLSASKSGGEQGIDSIDARVNNLLWVLITESSTTPHAFVNFGGAPTVDGELFGALAPGVIQVHNVPEPATAAFCLLLGLPLTLLRRRRS